MPCDPVVAARINEINAACRGLDCSPSVCVMLDGNPKNAEWMVLVGVTVNQDDDGSVNCECDVMDLELRTWAVDVRHISAVRKQ